MRRILFVALALVTVGAVVPTHAIPLPRLVDSVTLDCLEPVPQAVHVPVVELDNNKEDEVFLDVFFVLDRGVPVARAADLVARMQETYNPMNITVRLAGTREVTLTTNDGQVMIAQTRELLGGQRPEGSDVVATLTTANLSAGGLDIAGIADCIGGVRWATRAFLAAENSGDAATDFGFLPFWMYGNYGAKVVGHEIGHLLGAHHHYSDCVQGNLTETTVPKPEASPCTIMTTLPDFISINFGVQEALVVRAHTEEFARP